MSSRRGTLAVGAAAALSLLVVALAPAARADEPVENRALAADLFDAGVKKMERGKCTTDVVDTALCQGARDDFRRAVALFPSGLGALRNLAYVEKGLNLVGSASRHFRELARRAPLDPNPVRRPWADFARQEADALEQRVPHVKLQIPSPSPERMTLMLDGVPLPEAAWGAEVTLDPGAHALHAEAPRHAPLDVTFSLAEHETRAIAVALTVDPGTADALPAAHPSTGADGADGPARSRVPPLIVAGAGLATVAVGLGLGAVAIQKHADACGGSIYCDPEGLASGRSVARGSTIVTGIGGGVLAIGIAWYLLTPPARTSKAATLVVPYASPTGAGIFATRGF